MSNRVIDPRASERRRSLLLMIAATVVLVAVAASVILWATHKEHTAGGSEVPTVVTSDGAIRVTTAPPGTEPTVIVSLIEDLQCPICANFEENYGTTLSEAAKNPKVAVDYGIVGWLNRYSTDEYSSRAANASLCVAESTGKGHDFRIWLNYLGLLFANQPAEGGAGLTDSQLIAFAKEAGASDVSGCVRSRDYAQWLVGFTKRMTSRDGFRGTPDIRINGAQFEMPNPPDPTALANAVDAAVRHS